MFSLKRAFVLCVGFILCLALLGCGSDGDTKKKPRESEDLSAASSGTAVSQTDAVFEIRDGNGNTLLTEQHISSISKDIDDSDGDFAYVLDFELTNLGTGVLARITTENVGRNLSVYCDGKLISSPFVAEPIVDGSFQLRFYDADEINGLFDIISAAMHGIGT